MEASSPTPPSKPSARGCSSGPTPDGLVADEQAFFLPEANTHKSLTKDDFEKYAASFGPQHAEILLSKYPLANYDSQASRRSHGARREVMHGAAIGRQWAKYVASMPMNSMTAPRRRIFPISVIRCGPITRRNCNICSRFFTAAGTPHPLNAAQQKLSDDLVDYWTTFARSGNPNPPQWSSTEWPRYSPAADTIQSLNLPAPKTAGEYGKANDCSLWDRILSFQ